MGFLSILLGTIGLGIGFVFGICLGFYFFIYSDPEKEPFQDPVVKPISELDLTSLQDLIPEIPLWLKNPDYDPVDWLNKFLLNMWPCLDKAICDAIRRTTEPIISDYIGHGHRHIKAITFEMLSLGTLPPIFQGVKVCEIDENQLVMEPAIKWAGNPNIVMVVKISAFRIKIQLVDLQVFVVPRVVLKPLVPSFPCFSNVIVSLMEKPHVDFGLKVLGGDVMSIPGLYSLVQDIIKKEIAKLYLWPQTLEIPILDSSLGIVKKPVGVLHVKVVRATKLMKMDIIGLSDPYVKLKLSGEMFPSKKTTIKKKTLNPVWNETFKLVVKDPQAQTLQVNVYDWDKVGSHDRLGMQVVPLKLLTANETMDLTLDLLKNTNVADPHKKRERGQIMLELTYAPFKEDCEMFSGPLTPVKRDNSVGSGCESPIGAGAGVLLVTIQGAEDVEGQHHSNPYAMVIFRGETKKTKRIRRTRDPKWNEEFEFMLEEPPIQDKIHIKIMSKRSRMSFYHKESLGHVDINLADVVYNGRINHKFHLIDSKNGLVHVELRWRET
ncbi:synaptotagmin-3-like [Bidens hawaiensis]|uniref:synaptotagmin-3-like n=1 Tax=Bidens hawaiensis TaxID=980011 RepID=UPI0040491FA0